MTVVGADWASGVWVAAIADDSEVVARAFPAFLNIVNECKKGDTILVDTPIGLKEKPGLRKCDEHAKKYLRQSERGSSVFQVPCENAVYAGSYEDAKKQNDGSLGSHSWSLVFQIREVAAVSERVHKGIEILESHPEVCFLGLNEESVKYSKDTEQGRENRAGAFTKTGEGGQQYKQEFNRLLERANDGTSWQHRIGTARLDDALDALAMARAAELAIGSSGFDRLPEEGSETLGTIHYYEHSADG